MSYQKNEIKDDNVIVTPPDKTLIITAVFLVVIGVMSVFSAGSARAIAEESTPLFYLMRHLIWLVLGVAACFATSRFDYRKLKIWAMPFAIFVLVLLILTAFTGLGVSVNGAKRWLVVAGIQFQPSEFSKLAVILALASIFSKDTNLLDEKKMPYYIIFALMIALILKQPNLSMTILLLVSALAMYYCAGGSFKVILSCIGLSIPAALFFLIGYQRQRILVWLNPKSDPTNAGYNIIQSLVAFAEGGFFGVGYGNSKQKLSWLPEGHTDFIFSIIGEEFGFVGCVFLVGLFLVFIRRGFIIASRCPDMFGKLLAFGITFSIGMQAFINMSVASSFVPATGIPLPFISYGGSSLFISLAMLGVLLNISKKKVQKITPKRYGE